MLQSRTMTSFALSPATFIDGAFQSTEGDTKAHETRDESGGTGSTGRKKKENNMNHQSLVSQSESLNVLEWPSVCRQVGASEMNLLCLSNEAVPVQYLKEHSLQVACFCSTVMATELIVSGGLPVGQTQEESERLLRQTTEALESGLRQVSYL